MLLYGEQGRYSTALSTIKCYLRKKEDIALLIPCETLLCPGQRLIAFYLRVQIIIVFICRHYYICIKCENVSRTKILNICGLCTFGSRVLGASSLLLVFSYPLMKRFTFWVMNFLNFSFLWQLLFWTYFFIIIIIITIIIFDIWSHYAFIWHSHVNYWLASSLSWVDL